MAIIARLLFIFVFAFTFFTHTRDCKANPNGNEYQGEARFTISYNGDPLCVRLKSEYNSVLNDRERELTHINDRSSYNRNFSLGTYDFIYLNPQVAKKSGLILSEQKQENPEKNKSWLFNNTVMINGKETNVDVSFSYINDHTLFGHIESEYGSNIFSNLFMSKSPMNVFGRSASSVYWFYPEIKDMIQKYNSNQSREFFYRIANSGALPQFGDGRIINTQIFKDRENKTVVLFGSSGYIPLVGAGAQFFFARFDGQSLQPMCLLISGIGSWSFNEGELSLLRALVGGK